MSSPSLDRGFQALDCPVAGGLLSGGTVRLAQVEPITPDPADHFARTGSVLSASAVRLAQVEPITPDPAVHFTRTGSVLSASAVRLAQVEPVPLAPVHFSGAESDLAPSPGPDRGFQIFDCPAAEEFFPLSDKEFRADSCSLAEQSPFGGIATCSHVVLNPVL